MKVCLYNSNIWLTPFYNKIFVEILNHNNIDFVVTSLGDSDFWENVKNSNVFIYRFTNNDYQIQEAFSFMDSVEFVLNKTVFPKFNSRFHYDDKVKQEYLLNLVTTKKVESYVFWEKSGALNWADDVSYPKIFKLRGGAGSSNVALVKSKTNAFKIIKKAFGKGIKHDRIPSSNSLRFKNIISFMKSSFYNIYTNYFSGKVLFWGLNKNYVLFQKYYPNNSFDTRITVIGNKAYGFRRFVRENDFRASGSGMIDYNPDEIDRRCIKIAFEISEKLNFDSMAYDFIYDEHNNPIICEISYTYSDKALYKCPGIWDKNLDWEEGNFWPGFLILKYLLKRNDLIQPNLKDVEI
ncbi:ATP-grasp domain-containing protein [Echinicola salinicaeni]|uniref:hypothetical protein n=1 Tax=Echinicola salinicaeni TaxID=2762757 RepID=UPI00164945AD|nr:hypothetical protein [Echinicola salinicaeni]